MLSLLLSALLAYSLVGLLFWRLWPNRPIGERDWRRLEQGKRP